jgi:hypothetical protein
MIPHCNGRIGLPCSSRLTGGIRYVLLVTVWAIIRFGLVVMGAGTSATLPSVFFPLIFLRMAPPTALGVSPEGSTNSPDSLKYGSGASSAVSEASSGEISPSS